MPSKTITVTNGDGSTRTITIPDRSRFAGVRTIGTNTPDFDEITVSNAASDVNGTWVRLGDYNGSPRWIHSTNSSTYIFRLNTPTPRWYIQDDDNDPKMVQSDNNLYDYPWDVPSWQSANGGTNYPNIEFSNQFKTITVDRTAPVITSDRKGASRPLLSKLVGGAAAAYSLRDLNDKAGNNKVVRVRRSGYNAERDFLAKEVSNGTLVDWVGTSPATPQNITGFTVSGITEESDMNGTYSVDGIINGKKKWVNSDANILWMSSGYWRWRYDGDTFFRSNDDTTYPWDVTTWTEEDGSGTPTFGSFVGGSITAGAGSGFVSVWYDQSGNGKDAVQPTSTEQPKIVNGGNLVDGGLLFEGGQHIDTTATFSFASGSSVSLFGVNKATGSTSGGKYLVKVGTYIIWRLAGGTRRMSLGGVNANAGSISGNEELWVSIMNVNSSGGTGNFFTNGTLTSEEANQYIGSSVVTNKTLNIGNSNWDGNINEVILYTSDQSANRPAIEANINNQYDIY